MEASRVIPHNNRLKRFRRIVGLSQKQVAKRLGLSDTSILSRWEKGYVYPNLGYLFRLCKIYKTNPQEIFLELWQKITEDHCCYENKLLADLESFSS